MLPTRYDIHPGRRIHLEPVTVPAVAPFSAWLLEEPRPGDSVVAELQTTSEPRNRVPWGAPITPGTYSLRDRDGALQFHHNDAGKTILVTYTGIGTVANAHLINTIQDAIAALTAFTNQNLRITLQGLFFGHVELTEPGDEHRFTVPVPTGFRCIVDSIQATAAENIDGEDTVITVSGHPANEEDPDAINCTIPEGQSRSDISTGTLTIPIDGHIHVYASSAGGHQNVQYTIIAHLAPIS